MYVCEDVCMVVFSYVCMYVWCVGIYPAVDPLDSTSRMLDPRVIGEVGMCMYVCVYRFVMCMYVCMYVCRSTMLLPVPLRSCYRTTRVCRISLPS